MDYDEYERQAEEIKKQNQVLLDLFRDDLKGLSPKTISRHINNVDFYLNDYLQYEEPQTFEAGITSIDDFLGYFFIRKCMWSTPASIKTTAASIRKFYKSMLNHGKISQEDYDELCSDIKFNMDDWISTCAQYNDEDAPNPFYYGDL